MTGQPLNAGPGKYKDWFASSKAKIRRNLSSILSVGQREGDGTMNTQDSDYRLGELILFVCQKSETDIYFGAVKLNKILWYADSFAYAHLGDLITGAEYWNLPEGPAPKRLVQVRSSLLGETPPALAIQLNHFPNFVQHKPIQLRPPQLRDFRGDQLAIVEEVIRDNWNLTATEISLKSHKEWGWKLTKRRETIKPEIFLLSPETEKLSEEELDRIVGTVAV